MGETRWELYWAAGGEARKKMIRLEDSSGESG